MNKSIICAAQNNRYECEIINSPKSYSPFVSNDSTLMSVSSSGYLPYFRVTWKTVYYPVPAKINRSSYQGITRIRVRYLIQRRSREIPQSQHGGPSGQANQSSPASNLTRYHQSSQTSSKCNNNTDTVTCNRYPLTRRHGPKV